MKGKVYERRCINKGCKKKFTPRGANHVVCSPECGIVYAKTVKAKEWKAEKKERKDKLKNRTEHLKELQVIFNKYVRLRDANKGCISCGTPLKGKYDAGHFLSVGAYPNLRFNENNNHGQCVHCNQHKHGNIAEYQPRLIERIGQTAYEKLWSEREKPLKLTLPEILELKEEYKTKIKELKSILNQRA